MIWAQNFPPTDTPAVPFPTTAGSLTTRQRAVRVISIVLLFTLVALSVGYVATKYFRLAALDDYRTGYAFGSAWNETGERTEQCRVAMEGLYGRGSWTGREPGWGEFLVGCEDGARGEPAVAWYGLRERLWGGGGGD